MIGKWLILFDYRIVRVVKETDTVIRDQHDTPYLKRTILKAYDDFPAARVARERVIAIQDEEADRIKAARTWADEEIKKVFEI